MAPSRLTGPALAGSAAIAIGSSFVALRVLVRYPFLGGQAIRYGLASVAIAAARRLLRQPLVRPTRNELVRLSLLATVGQVGFNLAVLSALQSAEPAAVGAIVGCVPVVLAVAVAISHRRAPSRRMMVAAVVVVMGALIVQGLGHSDGAGLLKSLGALAAEAAFSLLALPLLPRLGPGLVSMYACAAAAVELTILAAISGGGGALRAPTAGEGLALAYLALVVTAAAFVGWYAGVLRLGADRAGLFAGLIPVSAALAAPLFGTGRLGLPEIAGSVLVGLGVAFGISGSVGADAVAVPRRGDGT